MKTYNDQKENLKKLIIKKALKTSKNNLIVSKNGIASSWLIDLRSVLLDPKGIELSASLFWENMKIYYPFQIGGIELSSIPLITAIQIIGNKLGYSVNAFIIRKERKKTGLQRNIEGYLNKKPIILIDDLTNTANSFLKMYDVLRLRKNNPTFFFTIIDFNNFKGKKIIKDLKAKFISIYKLNDFNLQLSKKKNTNEKYINANLICQFHFPFSDYYHTQMKNRLNIINNKEALYLSENSSLIYLNLIKKQAKVLFDTNIDFPKHGASNILFDNQKKIVYWMIYQSKIIAFSLNKKDIIWTKNIKSFDNQIIQSKIYIIYKTKRNKYINILEIISKNNGEKEFEIEINNNTSYIVFENILIIKSDSKIQEYNLNNFEFIKDINILSNGNIINITKEYIYLLENEKIIKIFDKSKNNLFNFVNYIILTYFFSKKYILIQDIEGNIYIYSKNNNNLIFTKKNFTIVTSFYRIKNYFIISTDYSVFILNKNSYNIIKIRELSEKIVNTYLVENNIIILCEGNLILYCQLPDNLF